MRHFALKDSGHPARPAFLFEIDIDFRDVRSGLQVTDHGYYRGTWLENPGEMAWTDDMVRRVASEDLVAVEPPRDLHWPEWADRLILDHLLSCYRATTWRNSALGIYAHGGESREEFEARCREDLREARFQELKQVREIFLHRIVELENRARRELEGGDWDQKLEARAAAQIVTRFSAIREDLSRWFVSDDHQLIREQDVDWSLPAFPDIQDRLGELKRDLASACNRVSMRYEEQARAVEPHEVRLTLPAVAIVSRNILWESASQDSS